MNPAAYSGAGDERAVPGMRDTAEQARADQLDELRGVDVLRLDERDRLAERFERLQDHEVHRDLDGLACRGVAEAPAAHAAMREVRIDDVEHLGGPASSTLSLPCAATSGRPRTGAET